MTKLLLLIAAVVMTPTVATASADTWLRVHLPDPHSAYTVYKAMTSVGFTSIGPETSNYYDSSPTTTHYTAKIEEHRLTALLSEQQGRRSLVLGGKHFKVELESERRGSFRRNPTVHSLMLEALSIQTADDYICRNATEACANATDYYSHFQTKESIYARMDTLANTYSDYVSYTNSDGTFKSIGNTYEGRQQRYYVLAEPGRGLDLPSTDTRKNPVHLMWCGAHPREFIAVAFCPYTMEQILTNQRDLLHNLT